MYTYVYIYIRVYTIILCVCLCLFCIGWSACCTCRKKYVFYRPYFKESLQLHRNEEMSYLKFFLSFPSNFRWPFFSHFLEFLHINHSQIAASTQLHRQILLTFLSSFTQHFLNIVRFSPLFFTLALPNLQLQLHNCHFTTANYINFYNWLQKLSSIAR